MKQLAPLATALAASLAGAGAFVYLGAYNVAADEKHWAFTERVLQTLRAKSIEVRARQVRPVPDLEDPNRISIGAGQYAEMCVGCHLAPGMKDSPMRQGLYPQPPNLSAERVGPRAAFWVTKHGIKMTGMPAWGASHDDDTIWAIVAFLQELPTLDRETYERLTANAPADQDMRNMPGMKAPTAAGATTGEMAPGHHGNNPKGARSDYPTRSTPSAPTN